MYFVPELGELWVCKKEFQEEDAPITFNNVESAPVFEDTCYLREDIEIHDEDGERYTSDIEGYLVPSNMFQYVKFSNIYSAEQFVNVLMEDYRIKIELKSGGNYERNYRRE